MIGMKRANEEKSPACTLPLTTRKEEMFARIKRDGQDRHALRDKLDPCIDPLDPGQQPSDGLVLIGAVSRGQHELAETNVPATPKLTTALLTCLHRKSSLLLLQKHTLLAKTS